MRYKFWEVHRVQFGEQFFIQVYKPIFGLEKFLKDYLTLVRWRSYTSHSSSLIMRCFTKIYEKKESKSVKSR